MAQIIFILSDTLSFDVYFTCCYKSKTFLILLIIPNEGNIKYGLTFLVVSLMGLSSWSITFCLHAKILFR
jgi:hypothetical protein